MHGSHWHIARHRVLRTSGIVFLVLLAVFAGLSFAAAVVLFLGIAAVHRSVSIGSGVIPAAPLPARRDQCVQGHDIALQGGS